MSSTPLHAGTGEGGFRSPNHSFPADQPAKNPGQSRKSGRSSKKELPKCLETKLYMSALPYYIAILYQNIPYQAIYNAVELPERLLWKMSITMLDFDW